MRTCEITKTTPIKGGRFMKKFSLIMVLTMVAMLVFAGYAMAAPSDTLEGFEDGVQNTSPYYSYSEVDGEPVYGSSIAEYDGYMMMDPRLLDEEAWEYELYDEEGVPTGESFAVVNANRSGEKTGKWSDFRRRVSGQAVHTRFATNTNSCASCHMTHTAQGANLLFRANNYATCAACHDGSGIPMLNVFRPSEAIIQLSGTDEWDLGGGHHTSGTFGVNPAMNGSVHLATGDVAIAAAPGGNRVGHLKDGTEEDTGDWSADFSCTSCHAPHGSYSFRLLHWNTNNISMRTPDEGGFWFEGLVTDANGNLWLNDPEVAPVYGFEKVGDNYMVTAPLVYTTSRGAVNSIYINGETGRDIDLTAVDFGAATVTGEYEAGTVVNAGLSLVVEGQDEDGYYKTGLEYNFYCAACHTDYERKLTAGAVIDGEPAGGGAGVLTGIYSDAHRHTTHRTAADQMTIQDTGGNMMCVSCHYVHGTDALIMKTADERVIGTMALEAGEPGTEEFNAVVNANKDINTSSAIKRHTNMAVCWGCHSGTKNDVFVNTDYFWNDVDTYDDTFDSTRGWWEARD
ncbi:cytochrome c3 family protein [Dethiobacter alkaliphilus]|uniref:Multiheme cytochrome n=1 Tax=Dethiobacter alkaliphilus AHT 1 TaxID=555088 RepID=C0GG34_DETAL|nr:cytochrome c3 family protein [Dethiobacter alkaliphilus]EEG77723.1 multiheme cytochrome [Dethiobacter alkaliphilus AHT 1]